MNNSTNKWPYNYKLFQSAIQPNAPTLEIVSSTSNSVELAWTVSNNTCYPVSSFSIFVNNRLYKTIANSTDYTTTLSGLYNGPYDIYIISILSGNSSQPSNVVLYNNEIVVKTSLNADNKTYSDSVTDLSNQITDIASGGGIGTGNGSGNGTGNGTGNGGSSIFNTPSDYYVVENANNSSNSVVLPDNLITENNKSITIFNKTESILTILSTANIYNMMYAPNGTNALEIAQNSSVTLTYMYDRNNIPSIYANIT
jgi:hypothetical protein